MRLSQTVPSSSNCPTVQGLIKDPDYSKVESITEGESETSAPPSGSSISGQKPLGTMSDENNRLETYRGHRHHFPHNNRHSLSQAGFYYVGPGDRVRCFSCGRELENWENWDDPLTRHLHSFPDCPNVRDWRVMSPIIGQSQYLLHMSERPSQTFPSSSNCPTVQGLIKDPDYSKVKSITEGESETSAPPSGSSISGQKPLGTMSDEYNRLDTYRGHSHHFPHNNQRSLSRAGFYYVGPGDRVRCFSCGGELENWQPGDEPLTQHRLSFPDCPYVLELEAEMSSIFGQYQYSRKESPLLPMRERLGQTVPSSSNCPTVQGQIKDPDYSKVESITEGESETSAPPSGSSISGQKPLGTMSDEHNRLETYRGHCHHFPHHNRQSLSRAGFYYVGPGDRVRCFSCGGELENWEFRDDPLTRHRLSFPDCPYVLERRAKTLPILCRSQTVFASAFLGLSLIDFSSSHRPRPLSDQDTPMSLHMRNEGERFHSPVTSSSVTRCLKSDSASKILIGSIDICLFNSLERFKGDICKKTRMCQCFKGEGKSSCTWGYQMLGTLK
ncbi:hypothetical protein XELAEV_18001490mg [Xenopus laevis]|nr:hypothetical protein XELAEV_18001490mg [Xenopus laevis]